MQDAEFAEFLSALRRGDYAAVGRLVDQFGPEIARLIRMRLAGNNLRRITDSADICQSILFAFCQHAAAGEFDLQSPAELEKLLRTMALNKLRDLSRREQAGKRDQRRLVPGAGAEAAMVDAATQASSPSQHVALADLLDQFRRALSPAARQIHEWRALNWTWDEIGRELQEPPSVVRIRFARETQRVARQLGLEGPR